MSNDPTKELKMSPERIKDHVKQHIWKFLDEDPGHGEALKKRYIAQKGAKKVAERFLANKGWSSGLAMEAQNLGYLEDVVKELGERGLK